MAIANKKAPRSVSGFRGCWHKGYDPAAHDSASEPALSRITYQEIRAEWNAADPRVSRAFEMSESGYDIEDIMAELKLSRCRVYQLIKEAKEMAKQSH